MYIFYVMTDLRPILYPFKDRDNRMDLSFTTIIEQTRELQTNYGSITNQVNQLREELNGKPFSS